jgi:hypothetical protein
VEEAKANPRHLALYKAGLLNRPIERARKILDRAGVKHNIPAELPKGKRRNKRTRRNDAARRS